MAKKLEQERRIAKLTTPLGTDVLAVSEFHGSEGLSELFQISIEALSEREDIDFNTVIGQACTLTLHNFDGAQRHFNGILSEAEWHGKRDDVFVYRLTLRPWTWLLGHVTDCRIFHQKSVIDIVRAVFASRGLQDFRIATTQSYPPIEYCVQYRETDLNFVQRLFEQFGIYFFFEHSAGRHTLVLADSKASHKPIEGLPSVRYQPQDGDSRHDRQWIGTWVSARQFSSGKVAFNDYNFKTPTANMLAQKAMPGGYTHGSLEVYDYPGKYPALSEGEDRARAAVEAEQAVDRRRLGSGAAASLFPGGLVKLESHPRGSENAEYVIVRCRHAFLSEQFRSGGSGSGSVDPYSGSYEFLPGNRKFRAPMLTPRPIVHGPQTAVVTGDSGEEIDVDKFGRVLVRFFWDRDKGQSCRARVAQVWAGKNWGGQVIPRIGQEVVVEFLEGDPDKPLVTGTVYNADNMPPYSLPDNKTMAGVKSNSTKGGGGFNEFVFEDKKSSEKIRMHAEKDHEVVIRNQETVQIGERFMPPVGSPSRTHVIQNGDDSLTVTSGSQDVSIGQNQTLKMTMNRSADVGMNDTVTVGMAQSVTAGLSIQLTASGGEIMIGPPGITLTAATINLVGIVNITGGLNVEGPTLINGTVPMPTPA